MLHFILRFFALAIRFICPLAALTLSDAETMGAYYLFISYFSFVVGISSLELAVPFSKKYLRCKSDMQQRVLFSGFLVNLTIVSTVLAIPTGVISMSWAGVPSALIPLFCLVIATEACVNEVGRFFWNIGEWKMPSLRDLIRSVIFTTGVLLSVYIENEILTPTMFLILIAGNLLIIIYEWKYWGRARLALDIRGIHILNSSWLRVCRSMRGSMHQFLQMQLLGLQPLLERSLIEKTLGLSTLASLSFLTSVMQSSASLQIVPLVANLRQLILSARSVSERIEANRQVILFTLKAAVISAGWGIAVYMTIPFINDLLEKNLALSPSFLFVAYCSSLSAIFCSAVAPIFTLKNIAPTTNFLTALTMCFLLFGQYFAVKGSDLELFFIIGGVAILQIICRALFIVKDINNLKLIK
jgi:hypothetical protein